MNTAEDRNWQIDECEKVWHSFEYFLDEYVYIEDKENKTALKLSLWPEQRKVIPALFNEMLLVLLKTRQIGLTWLSAALVIWLGIRNPLFLTIIISASEDHAIEFLNRVYFILDRLPSWLYPPIKTRTKQILEFRHYNNLVSTIKSMPTIEMGAESKTPNLLIIDEAHTIRNVQGIFNSSYPGIEQAKGQVIVIANSVKTGPGWPWVRDTYTKSMKGENKFKRIFLPWMAHPERPKDFRKRMIAAGMDELDVQMHYPETEDEAISTMLGSYFGPVLGRHKHTKNGIKGNIERDKNKEIDFAEDARGIIELWRWPYATLPNYDHLKWNKRYCMGADVSEGLGESFSVAYVMDRLYREFVCRIRSNRVDAYEWANILHMLSLWYDNALICTENTGAGQTTVKRLQELKANQYVKTVSGVVGSGLTKVYGWSENNQSKHELCGDLKQFLKTTTGTIYCGILIDECSTFIRLDGGKLDHEEGKLSDCVIAAGLTVEADIFLGEKPWKDKAPLTGWRKREYERKEGNAIWAA